MKFQSGVKKEWVVQTIELYVKILQSWQIAAIKIQMREAIVVETEVMNIGWMTEYLARKGPDVALG